MNGAGKWLKWLVGVTLVAVVSGCDGLSRDESELHRAAARGDVAKVRTLLDKGVNPNRQSRVGQCFTPLLSAAANCDLAVIRLLLERGADPRIADRWRVTPLEWATYEGDDAVPVVELLLKHGAQWGGETNAILNDGINGQPKPRLKELLLRTWPVSTNRP